jgi:Zn-dependent protease with chaperone function
MPLLMSLKALAKSGAIVSSAGIALIVAFVVVLLAFPVIKKCDEHGKCSYRSTAPLQLQSIVQPSFLAISLLSISAGVLMLRFSRWREREKTERGT